MAGAGSVPQPLADPLIALGKPGLSPNITAPIIDDSGSYAGGPIIRGRNTSTTTGYGVAGITQGTGAGLYGSSTAAAGIGATYGVYGASTASHGVFGHANATGAGVVGTSAQGYGVEGATASATSSGGYFTNTAGGTAVDAASTGGYGIFGSSVSSIGVYGSSRPVTLGSLAIATARQRYTVRKVAGRLWMAIRIRVRASTRPLVAAATALWLAATRALRCSQAPRADMGCR